MPGDRLAVAARDGAGERAGGTELVDVLDRPADQRKERLERHACVRGEPLDLAEQRHEVVRGDARSGVVADAPIVAVASSGFAAMVGKAAVAAIGGVERGTAACRA